MVTQQRQPHGHSFLGVISCCAPARYIYLYESTRRLDRVLYHRIFFSQSFQATNVAGVMLSVDDLGTCHPSQRPAPKRWRSTLSTCDLTANSYHAEARQSCDFLNGNAAFEHDRQDLPRAVTAADPIDFKRGEIYLNRSFDDAQQSVLSSEKCKDPMWT